MQDIRGADGAAADAASSTPRRPSSKGVRRSSKPRGAPKFRAPPQSNASKVAGAAPLGAAVPVVYTGGFPVRAAVNPVVWRELDITGLGNEEPKGVGRGWGQSRRGEMKGWWGV